MGYSLVIDIDTPNQKKDRICSICVIKIEPGQPFLTNDQLIDPECDFDPLNIEINGITPAMVRGKRNFKDYWTEMGPVFIEADYVVAHYAQFDLEVLSRTLMSYGLPCPKFIFIDSIDLAKSFIKIVRNYKLETLARFLKIEFKPQTAVRAAICLTIYYRAFSCGIDVDKYLNTFDLREGDIQIKKRSKPKLSERADVNHELEAFLRARLVKKDLDNQSFDDIVQWIRQHPHCRGQFPYDEVAEDIASLPQNHELSSEQLEWFQGRCHICIDPAISQVEQWPIEISGKTFCFLGECQSGSQEQLTDLIRVSCGVVCSKLTPEIDYVILGEFRRKAWIAGTAYEKRIFDVIDWIRKGSTIRILWEAPFIKQLLELSLLRDLPYWEKHPRLIPPITFFETEKFLSSLAKRPTEELAQALKPAVALPNDSDQTLEASENVFGQLLFKESYALALSVKPANHSKDEICALTWVKIVDGKIIGGSTQLIRPLYPISESLSEKHQIDGALVVGEPTFKEYWAEFQSLLLDANFVIAYDALGLLEILTRTAQKNDLSFGQYLFLDIRELISRYFRWSGDDDLESLAETFDWEYAENHWGSEALICAHLYCRAIHQGMKSEKYLSLFDGTSTEKMSIRGDIPQYQPIDAVLKSFLRFLKDSVESGPFDEEHFNRFIDELSAHDEWIPLDLYRIVVFAVDFAAPRGALEGQKQVWLFRFCQACLDPFEPWDHHQEIKFTNLYIKLLEPFKTNRSAVFKQKIREKGGIVSELFDQYTDILIVGDYNRLDWLHGVFHPCILEALKLIAKGSELRIISESALLSDLEGISRRSPPLLKLEPIDCIVKKRSFWYRLLHFSFN